MVDRVHTGNGPTGESTPGPATTPHTAGANPAANANCRIISSRPRTNRANGSRSPSSERTCAEVIPRVGKGSGSACRGRSVNGRDNALEARLHGLTSSRARVSSTPAGVPVAGRVGVPFATGITPCSSRPGASKAWAWGNHNLPPTPGIRGMTHAVPSDGSAGTGALHLWLSCIAGSAAGLTPRHPTLSFSQLISPVSPLPVSSIAELELTHLVAAPRPFRQSQARSDFVSRCCSPRRLPAGDGG